MAEVFACVEDLANLKRWQAGALESWRDGPARAGARERRTRRLGGRYVHFHFVYREYERDRRVVCDGATSGTPFTVTVEFEPAGARMRLRYAMERRTRGLARLGDPFLGFLAKRQVMREYATLRRLLEARQ